jgi:hypothetical protein
MEHRWGQRWDVERSITIRTRGGLAARGCVRNVSISGAFIASPLPVRLLSYVQVHFVAEQGAHRVNRSIDGQVVRRAADGFAVEWCEFAPDSVLALAHPTEEPAPEGTPSFDYLSVHQK